MNKRLDKIEDIEQMIKEEENKQRGLKFTTGNVTVIFTLPRRQKSFKQQILEHSRKNYYEGGIFNEKRNCYYPKDREGYKNEAEYNKMEKLFRKLEAKI
jgi:hypothetical protein